jgi:hypothetical protein
MKVVDLRKTKEKISTLNKLKMIKDIEHIVGDLNAVIDHGEEIVPELIWAIENCTIYKGIPFYGIEALGHIGDPRAVECIKKQETEYPEICRWALRRIELKQKLKELSC